MIASTTDMQCLRLRGLRLLAAERSGDTAQADAQRRAAAIEGFTADELADEAAMLAAEFGGARADLLTARARELTAALADPVMHHG